MNYPEHVSGFWGRCFLVGLALSSIWLGGCGLAPNIAGLRSGSTEITYNPLPGSPEFRSLQMEKFKSVVVLNIGGDDIRGNMEKVYHIMLKKGYSVRDPANTIRILKRSNLLGKNGKDPDSIQKAAAIFNEQIGIVGDVELIQIEPIRVLVSLSLVDLKKKKVIWSVKASYSGRYFSVVNPYERAVFESVERAFSVIPRAKP